MLVAVTHSFNNGSINLWKSGTAMLSTRALIIAWSVLADLVEAPRPNGGKGVLIARQEGPELNAERSNSDLTAAGATTLLSQED